MAYMDSKYSYLLLRYYKTLKEGDYSVMPIKSIGRNTLFDNIRDLCNDIIFRDLPSVDHLMQLNCYSQGVNFFPLNFLAGDDSDFGIVRYPGSKLVNLYKKLSCNGIIIMSIEEDRGLEELFLDLLKKGEFDNTIESLLA